jgi:hypothetical protein
MQSSDCHFCQLKIISFVTNTSGFDLSFLIDRIFSLYRRISTSLLKVMNWFPIMG